MKVKDWHAKQLVIYVEGQLSGKLLTVKSESTGFSK